MSVCGLFKEKTSREDSKQEDENIFTHIGDIIPGDFPLYTRTGRVYTA